MEVGIKSFNKYLRDKAEGENATYEEQNCLKFDGDRTGTDLLLGLVKLTSNENFFKADKNQNKPNEGKSVVIKFSEDEYDGILVECRPTSRQPRKADLYQLSEPPKQKKYSFKNLTSIRFSESMKKFKTFLEQPLESSKSNQNDFELFVLLTYDIASRASEKGEGAVFQNFPSAVGIAMVMENPQIATEEFLALFTGTARSDRQYELDCLVNRYRREVGKDPDPKKLLDCIYPPPPSPPSSPPRTPPELPPTSPFPPPPPIKPLKFEELEKQLEQAKQKLKEREKLEKEAKESVEESKDEIKKLLKQFEDFTLSEASGGDGNAE